MSPLFFCVYLFMFPTFWYVGLLWVTTCFAQVCFKSSLFVANYYEKIIFKGENAIFRNFPSSFGGLQPCPFQKFDFFQLTGYFQNIQLFRQAHYYDVISQFYNKMTLFLICTLSLHHIYLLDIKCKANLSFFLISIESVKYFSLEPDICLILY